MVKGVAFALVDSRSETISHVTLTIFRSAVSEIEMTVKLRTISAQKRPRRVSEKAPENRAQYPSTSCRRNCCDRSAALS